MQNKVLLNRKVYDLGPDCYQLLIGNPTTYRGRQAAHAFEKIHAIEFKPLSEENLRSLVAEPLLKENTTSFWNTYRRKHKELTKQTTRDIAHQSIKYLMKQEKNESLSASFPVGSTLNELYITQNWSKSLKKLQTSIDTHQYRVKNGISSGKQGVLIEGDSSLGKTSFIRALLEKNQIDFVDLTGRRVEDIEGLLLQAFDGGKYVLWDEINTTAPLFKRLLNHLMSGTDLEKNPPKKQGFFIIGTLNAASGYTGRVPLDPALENRFEKQGDHIHLCQYIPYC